MGDISKQVAVATAALNYDLLTALPEAREPFARTIIGIGFVGSAAVGDAEFELRVGSKIEGKFQNTTVGVSGTNPGAVSADKDLKKTDIYVPANAQIQALVTDAPATNDVRIELHFGRPARTGGYRGGNRRKGAGASRRVVRRGAPGMYS